MTCIATPAAASWPACRPGTPLVAALGAAAVADAVRAARAAGMTALVLSAVADFAVLRPDPATGLRAHRDFRAGEAYADYQRQLAGIREAAAEAGAEVATSAADLDRAARDGRTAVLLGCEGGDFLEGDLRRLEEARTAGLTVLTLVHYRVSEIGDVQTEAPVHDGLSRFGRDVVAECNRLGIVVDCAHASFATTMAVLEASSQPVIISHGQLGYPGPTPARAPPADDRTSTRPRSPRPAAWSAPGPAASPAAPSPTSAPRSSGSPRRPARTTWPSAPTWTGTTARS